MAAGSIEVLGSDVFCSIADGGREARFPLVDATPKLHWANRYDRAFERDDEGELAAIGRAMFDWLDRDGWASAWADAVGEDRLGIFLVERKAEVFGGMVISNPKTLGAVDATVLEDLRKLHLRPACIGVCTAARF